MTVWKLIGPKTLNAPTSVARCSSRVGSKVRIEKTICWRTTERPTLRLERGVGNKLMDLWTAAGQPDSGLRTPPLISCLINGFTNLISCLINGF